MCAASSPMFVVSMQAATMRSNFVDAMAASASAQLSCVAPPLKKYSPSTCEPPERMPVVAAPDEVLPVVMSVTDPAAETNAKAHVSVLPRGPRLLAVSVTAPAVFCAVKGSVSASLIASATAAAITVAVSPDATGTSRIFPQA